MLAHLVCFLARVQGYQAGGGGGARRNAAGPAGPASDLEAGAVVGRYLQQYEQSINPFAGQICPLARSSLCYVRLPGRSRCD